MEWKTEDAVALVKIACEKKHLAPGALETIKSVCKKSTDAVAAVHSRLWSILTSPRQKCAQKREIALKILSELFLRSRTMRELVVPKCDRLSEAALFSGLKNSSELRKLGIRTLKAWHRKFKGVYGKLDCLMQTLTNKGVDFEELELVESREEAAQNGEETAPSTSGNSRLEEIIDETVQAADVATAEVRSLFEIIVPLSNSSSRAANSGSSVNPEDEKATTSGSTIQLDLNFSKIRVKREGAVELVESQLRPIVAQLEKLGKRLRMWIGGDLFIEAQRLEQIVSANSQVQLLLRKYKSLNFYDDSEDEEDEFEDVSTDEEAAEAEYMKEIVQPKKQETKNTVAKNDDRNKSRIPISELENHSKTSDNFVDTRNSVSAQLVERHHFTSPDSEVNLDRAKSMAGTIYYTTEDIAIEEKRITRTCRAPMPNGKLCSRMDAEKCPFHGKIVDRDVQGAVVGQLASPTPAQDKELKEMLEIENLHGCYLLCSLNPSTKGRTYIGYTVNPQRRIMQHNSGIHKGGARKTNLKGPWTLFVYGFPSEISGLRFEWAWQNPKASRRLKHLPAKRSKETQYDYRVRIMSHMLHTSPWSRLPLNVCWFIEKYKRPLQPAPPSHVRVHVDFINCSKDQENEPELDQDDGHDVQVAESDSYSSQENGDERRSDSESDGSGSDESFMALVNNYRTRAPSPRKPSPLKPCLTQNSSNCVICTKALDKSALSCKDREVCQAQFHSVCLSRSCLRSENQASSFEQVIPVKFRCPSCRITSSWGEYIRSIKGHKVLTVESPKESPFTGMNCIRRIQKKN
ncbi:Oidioi.mRNA.OKI2018_I69.XSR.g17006.t1.cds [Oikopleura dioica]|uniref:Structure-specific endonuclease subunit SLX1 homolog n=1 Tax=Oikopleura dioica TaxID=34765 RepID=A0ABN7SHV8_OIKDI|nr:Oidioi.mRNA.OKI2018_I69.XSR.g17006.t1.cds [Oikopleura dioica]